MTALVHPAELLGAQALPLERVRRPWAALAQLVLLVAVFGLTYGAVMGMFGGWSGWRGLQVVYSAVKVPLLLLGTFAISLPSFFVFNTLMGLREDFAHAVRALAATQAGLTVILASLAPFTLVWYGSSDHYRLSILFNGLMFAVASLSSHVLLRRLYGPLIRRNARHKVLLRVWLATYCFVGIQMAWVLRPFVGHPRAPTRFFREGAWGNAYVEVARMVSEVVAG